MGDESNEFDDSRSSISSLSSRSSRASSLQSIQETIKQAESDLEEIDAKINKYNQIVSEITEKIEELSDKVKKLENEMKNANLIYQNTSVFERDAVNKAKKDKDQAYQAFEKAKEDLRTQEGHLSEDIIDKAVLITLREDVSQTLKELKSKEKDLTSGEISEFDDATTYSADNTALYSGPEMPLISSYAQEKPEIELRIKDLEGLISVDGHLKVELAENQQNLIDVKEDIALCEIMIAEKSEELGLDRFPKNIKEQQERLANVQPKGFFGGVWYEVKRAFLNMFGFKTTKQLIENSVNELHDKQDKSHNELENFKKEPIAEIEKLSSEAESYEKNIETLNQSIKGNNDKIEKEAGSLEQLREKIKKLGALAARDEGSVRTQLLEQCTKTDRSRVREHSVQVRESLRVFLSHPSERTLFQLRKAFAAYPDYTTDRSLVTLLAQVRELYPQIPENNQPRLQVSTEKAIKLIDQTINDNSNRVNQLENKQSKLTKNIQENAPIYEKKMEEIQQNKIALREIHRILFVARTRLRSAETEKNESEKAVAGKLVSGLEETVKYIERFIPDNSFRGFDRIEELADIDYESSSEAIGAILDKYNISLPEKLTLDNIKTAIQSSGESENIMGEINQLPEVLGQAEKETKFILETSDNIERLIRQYTGEKREEKINAIIDMNTNFYNTLREEANRAGQVNKQLDLDKASKKLYQMRIDFDKQCFDASNPEGALESFGKQLPTFDSKIQERFSAYFSDISEKIKQLLSCDVHQLTGSIKLNADSALEAKTFSPFAAEYRQQRSELSSIDDEIKGLVSDNAKLEQEKTEVLNGEREPNVDAYLLKLIDECGKIKPSIFSSSKDSPVRMKLEDFLNDSTRERLDELMKAMHDDKQYLKNEKLTALVAQAGEMYPELGKAHEFMLQVTPSSPGSSPGRSFKDLYKSIMTLAGDPRPVLPTAEEPEENRSNRR